MVLKKCKVIKPLAAFPHNNCVINGQQSNKCRLNDCHQSSKRILAEPGIEQEMFPSPIRYLLNYGLSTLAIPCKLSASKA